MLSYNDINIDLVIRILSIIVLLPTQLWLCFKVKKRLVRLLPVIILVLLVVSFLGIASSRTGWDSLGYVIFAIYTVYMLFVCVSGWLIWWIVYYLKHKKNRK